ncbi:MAG: hypothetical protein KGR18_08985 [Acidobacteria bacterium]|nr:hypothetical protein [Acidobacteriota bacterium]
MSDFYDQDGDEGELDLTPPAVGDQYHPAETENVLLELREVIANARPVPLSASSMISKDEVLNLIDEALDRLPEELRAARWLLKERVDYIAKFRREADDIVAQARARAERMVQRTEVVAAAEQRAYEIVDTAQTDARRLRHEVEDFCDQKLASFEIVLERTQRLVSAGRAKLQGTNLLAEAAAAAAAEQALVEDPTSAGFEADTEWSDGPSSVPEEYAQLSPAALEVEHPDGSLPFDDDDPFGERGSTTGHLTVVRGPYDDLPPPPDDPGPSTIRDAAATFFDQDQA